MRTSQVGVVRNDAILVVSSSQFRRYGFTQLLKGEAERVVWADTLDGVLSVTSEPDIVVIVLDLDLEGISGVNDVSRLHAARPMLPIITVSSTSNHQQMIDVLNAGARGYLDEAGITMELVFAVRCVRKGQIYLPESLSRRLPQTELANQLSLHSDVKLSVRQRQLLPLIAQGFSNKAIAQQLKISVSTAKFHVATLLRSLNSNNRAEAASKATLLLRRPMDL